MSVSFKIIFEAFLNTPNKMSDNVPMTPEARWRHLKENGPKLLINLQSNDIISEKPKWLDEERFAKAKATIEKFYIG